MNWYTIMVRSGYEKKIKLSLNEKIRQNRAEDSFGEIFIPLQETGKKLKNGTMATKNAMPGYMFVQMKLNDDTWHLVKNVTNVNTFVGDSKPCLIKDKEIQLLRGGSEITTADGTKKQIVKQINLKEGDDIKVISGAFLNFAGTVQSCSSEKQKVKVVVSIFGRDTSVELNVQDVERVS